MADRVCLVCGRIGPCTETPDACTFDPTPEELYAENCQLRKRVAELEAELAGKRQSPITYPSTDHKEPK